MGSNIVLKKHRIRTTPGVPQWIVSVCNYQRIEAKNAGRHLLHPFLGGVIKSCVLRHFEGRYPRHVRDQEIESETETFLRAIENLFNRERQLIPPNIVSIISKNNQSS